MVLPAMPKVMLALVLLEKTIVPTFWEAPAALMAREAEKEAVAVIVEPFIPNVTLLEFEKTMVPLFCEEPAALIAGTAIEAVIVLLVKPKLMPLLLAKEIVDDPTVDPLAAMDRL